MESIETPQDDDGDWVRDFADRVMREALLKIDNLREFMTEAVPKLAPGFDYSRALFVDPKFRLPDWRRRECDLLFEIPYRFDDGEPEALVCLLLEHQTRPDPRMPLRLIIEVVLYWERKWRAWEEAKSPKEEFRLTSVFPIVLHTGTKKWGSVKTLAEMLGPPSEFHSFAPVWTPMFWELSEYSPEQLLDAPSEFMQVLAVVRVEDQGREEFGRIFQETFKRLEAVESTSRVRWTELLQFIFGWVRHRRPRSEGMDWVEMAAAVHENDLRKQEVRTMGQAIITIADGVRIEEAHTFLLEQGTDAFGEPGIENESALKAIEDLRRLHRMGRRILKAKSWAELLETP